MEQELREAFGANMRAIRLLRGITQFQMAESMGLRNHGYIGLIERAERNFRLSTIASLCDAAGVDPFEMLRRPDEPGTPAWELAEVEAQAAALRAAAEGEDPTDDGVGAEGQPEAEADAEVSERQAKPARQAENQAKKKP